MKNERFKLKDTLDELKDLRSKTKSYRLKTRLLYLILKDDIRFSTLDSLSKQLDVSVSSLRRWRIIYQTKGLSELLTISNGGKRREVVTPDIHKGLEKKVNDSENPLLGYNHAIEWVKEEFGVILKYNTLRTYMKRHFKTKLKVPRKSHYKKDDQAVELFKKPSRCLKIN
jgi:transposase